MSMIRSYSEKDLYLIADDLVGLNSIAKFNLGKELGILDEMDSFLLEKQIEDIIWQWAISGTSKMVRLTLLLDKYMMSVKNEN